MSSESVLRKINLRRKKERKIRSSIITLSGGGKYDESIVLVLSISLQRDFGIVCELEIEIEPTRLEGIEEDGVRRPDREVVNEDQNSSTRRSIRLICRCGR